MRSRSRLMSGTTTSPDCTIQRARVWRGNCAPMRSNCFDSRYSGSPSTYFDVATKASSPGLAWLFGIGCAGIGAVRRCPSQHGQRYFTRRWRSTCTFAGTTSYCSQTSSPNASSTAPSWGHTRSASGSSWSTSMRGRCSGAGARLPRRRRLWPVTATEAPSPSSASGALSEACSSASLNSPSCPSATRSLEAAKRRASSN